MGIKNKQPGNSFYQQKIRAAAKIKEMIKNAGDDGLKLSAIRLVILENFGFGSRLVMPLLEDLSDAGFIEVMDTPEGTKAFHISKTKGMNNPVDAILQAEPIEETPEEPKDG